MIYLEVFYMEITMFFAYNAEPEKTITCRRGAHGGQVSAHGCLNIFGYLIFISNAL
jgi:hypothetical protein